MTSLLRAARAWLRAPRFTAGIVACVAISIAGAATVLTFVDALLIRPLPYPEPERLVLVEPRGSLGPGARPYLSYPNFVDLRERLRSFETLDGAMVSRLVVETPAGSERLRGETVTAGYFELFGLRPMMGRAFAADEYAGAGERAILLSTRIWRTRFGGDPAIVGRTIPTRAGPRTVVGVMPEGYLGVAEDEGTDVWLPERQSNHAALLTGRADPSILVFGRLARGVGVEAADAEVRAAVSVLAAEHPDANRTLSAGLTPFADRWRAPLRDGLLAMLFGAFFLLAIGCANVALLMLSRLVAKEREVAIRLAIGASGRQIVRASIVESAVVAAGGGALGIALALALVRTFAAAGATALPMHLPVTFGLGTAALCAGVVACAGLAFGALPAFVSSRVHPAGALRASGRGIASSALGGRIGRALVVAQTALAVCLLFGATLFLRSYEKLRNADFGFRTDSLLRYQIALQPDTFRSPEAVEAAWTALASDLRTTPGVRAVGFMAPTLPPYDPSVAAYEVKGKARAAGAAERVNLRYATNDAFEILGVALVRGRLFEPSDRRDGRPVALVSETLARRLGRDVGAQLLVGDGGPGHGAPVEVDVVGVVEDARWNGQRDRNPSGADLFLSLAQFPQLSSGALFDAAIDPRALVEPVRRVALRHDPRAALHWIDTMEEALDFQTAGERFWTMLAATFGGAAFLLAVFGLFGVLSHSVSARTQEIGVRLALGATRRAIVAMTVRDGLALVGSGLAAGVAFALFGGRAIASRLYEIGPADPVSFALVAALLLVTGLAASWLPARRASRTSPVEALRAD